MTRVNHQYKNLSNFKNIHSYFKSKKSNTKSTAAEAASTAESVATTITTTIVGDISINMNKTDVINITSTEIENMEIEQNDSLIISQPSSSSSPTPSVSASVSSEEPMITVISTKTDNIVDEKDPTIDDRRRLEEEEVGKNTMNTDIAVDDADSRIMPSPQSTVGMFLTPPTTPPRSSSSSSSPVKVINILNDTDDVYENMDDFNNEFPDECKKKDNTDNSDDDGEDEDDLKIDENLINKEYTSDEDANYKTEENSIIIGTGSEDSIHFNRGIKSIL
ncbi:conserved oligomeric Golgi complex subunit 8-like [Melanaphis sacchari]|uniref:conserved oligomeric Golgi complex subunit 8-like n=1 Tax=Melanaphis sacchari TaxID=742174 RepID=UPI000DC141B3|nr:conserved oligomeric Golgi complex subunit 8-like [Melanaphis sacchari]